MFQYSLSELKFCKSTLFCRILFVLCHNIDCILANFFYADFISLNKMAIPLRKRFPEAPRHFILHTDTPVRGFFFRFSFSPGSWPLFPRNLATRAKRKYLFLTPFPGCPGIPFFRKSSIFILSQIRSMELIFLGCLSRKI